MTAAVSLTKPKPTPVPDQSLATWRQRWDDNLRKQLDAVKATNRALTQENVALLRENAELQGRIEQARAVCAPLIDATLPRKILRILLGEDQ